MASLEVKTSFGVYKNCVLQVAKYQADDSMAIEIWNSEEGPIARITVCLEDKQLGSDEAYVDTNNCPWVLDFLKEYELAEETGVMRSSGYCIYPKMKFNRDKMREYEVEG